MIWRALFRERFLYCRRNTKEVSHVTQFVERRMVFVPFRLADERLPHDRYLAERGARDRFRAHNASDVGRNAEKMREDQPDRHDRLRGGAERFVPVPFVCGRRNQAHSILSPSGIDPRSGRERRVPVFQARQGGLSCRGNRDGRGADRHAGLHDGSFFDRRPRHG